MYDLHICVTMHLCVLKVCWSCLHRLILDYVLRFKLKKPDLVQPLSDAKEVCREEEES